MSSDEPTQIPVPPAVTPARDGGRQPGSRPAASDNGNGLSRNGVGSSVSGLTAPPDTVRAQAEDAPEVVPNGSIHRYVTLTAIVLPFAAFIAAVVLLWEKAVHPRDLALLVGMHVLAATGITVGFHRLLTHRSFETKPWVRGTFTALGSLAIEGRPTAWVADHRRHHAFADEPGDPHSPHAGFEPGIWGVIKGAFHAHVGWLITEGSTSVRRFAPDLLKDRVVMAIDKRFPWFIVLAFVIPAAIGFAITGSWVGAVSAAFWAGLVRMFLTHHITWSVNSICHMFGRRPFESKDQSTNNWVLALPTMGEAWHHNHHTFPTSAFHGLKRWQKALDPSGWVVLALEKTGLAWNVKRVSAQQMAAKLRAPRSKSSSV
ncbi:MAG TPA: acyl-CoA desaturase [Solirubrobacterales bacterium]|jgi:stearoyl-CoA desaturase (delta-9 desaturase)|nr:acyl-CoA desaturase [Solirubrobacterales bacterium]